MNVPALLHAAVRHLILEDSTAEGDHDDMSCRYARWGHPICQEDMAYTLQTFAYVVRKRPTSIAGTSPAISWESSAT